MTVESHAFNEPQELGERQHYIDNVTMFSGHTAVGYCIMALLIVTTPRLEHILYFFESLKLYSITLSLSRS